MNTNTIAPARRPISRRLQRQIGRECLEAARAFAVPPGALALINAAIAARAAAAR